jgi:uncharacterized tellurite resistance protein B-like protein
LVDIEQREKVVSLIEAVIAADGVVTDAERQFLQRVVARFGFTDRDRADRIVASAPGLAVTTLRTLPSDVQAGVMGLLVEAAIADGAVSPEERAILLAAAASLGIEAQALEDRIACRLKSGRFGG